MIMPLTMISEGKKAILLSIEGGRQLRSRLASLGMLPGAELEVIQNSGHGPFVISVKGSRIVIGRGMAARIAVE
jgi:ferrous iron transport protein A